VRLAPIPRLAKLARHLFGRYLTFGDDHHLGTPGNAGHQGHVAALAPHHLHQERPTVRLGGHFESVDSLQRHVDRRIYADGDVAAHQIVVDGRGDAYHRIAHLAEGVRARLRAVAADDHQRLDA